MQCGGFDRALEGPVNALTAVVNIAERTGKEIDCGAFKDAGGSVLSFFGAGNGVAEECADDLLAAGDPLGCLAETDGGIGVGFVQEAIVITGFLLRSRVAQGTAHAI